MHLRKNRNWLSDNAKKLALIFVCLAAIATTPAAASNQSRPNANSALHSYFAIADFDGDEKPDLASVDVQRESSSRDSNYAIRLELTSGAAQSFGLIAPTGGLQIVARDVNGDNALDLLVSSAWQHKEVAVLLNDGHGNFRLADPQAFPASIWGNESQWGTDSLAFGDGQALLRSENSAGGQETQSLQECLPCQAGLAGKPTPRDWSRLIPFSRLGRSPPTPVFRA